MKKETILLIVVTLVVGGLVGMIVTNSQRGSQTESPPVSTAPAVDYQKKIGLLQEVVAKEPANRGAWVQLGHSYFDSGQSMEAIAAYDKALELNSNDPNVLTDQGIMFRRVGWFDKAIENFNRANSLNPAHQQSLFNLGIVYRDDLQDIERAKEAWNRYLAVVPTGEGAERVKAMLEHLENDH